MDDDIVQPRAGWRCPKCEVYTSRPKEDHICLATKCAMCGWRWRAPLGVNIRHTSWGECCCNDVDTCLHHQVTGDGPDRPPQAELEARAQANYDADLKRWEFRRDQLDRHGRRWSALDEFWRAMQPHIPMLPDDPKLQLTILNLRNHYLMWKVTKDQLEFLKTRFRDPLLWLEDCERWAGRPLVGNKAHWCYDWDGLPVDETTKEFECCSCWSEETPNGIQKEDHQGETPKEGPFTEGGGTS